MEDVLETTADIMEVILKINKTTFEKLEKLSKNVTQWSISG